jgi:flagellar hook-length control protein FliK
VGSQSEAAKSGVKGGESFAQRFGSEGAEGMGASNGRGGAQNVRTITRTFDGNLHNLARNLRENAQPEIVRQARFIFRSESSGEIRLVLKPESLGQVRIQLQLQDNHIAGRIIVENSNVRDAFEENMQDLQKAFRDQGMETGSLEVSVGQQHESAADAAGRKGARKSPMASLLEDSVPVLEEIEDERGVVNLYA